MSSPTKTSTILRTSVIACLSSVTTIIIFLFLLRPGSNNIITTVVDRVRTSPEDISSTNINPTTEAAMKPPWQTFPKKFLEDPWKFNPYDSDRAEPSENLTKETWWDKLLTPNGGFLMVLEEEEEEEEEEEYANNNHGEAANKPTKPPEPVGYGISMFHQLHCLDMIRRRLLEDDQGNTQVHAHGSAIKVHGQVGNRDIIHERDQLSRSDEKGEPRMGNQEDEEEETEQDRAEKLRKFETMHLLHCFEYIAQAILCAADDALEASEPTELANGQEINDVNGENEIHQCKNASVLYDLVARSREKPVKRKDMGRYSVFT